MASITIRQLDEAIKQKLRLQAARHGRSMEAEVRSILARQFEEKPSGVGIGSQIQQIVKEDGFDEDIPLKQPERTIDDESNAVDFSDSAFGS